VAIPRMGFDKSESLWQKDIAIAALLGANSAAGDDSFGRRLVCDQQRVSPSRYWQQFSFLR